MICIAKIYDAGRHILSLINKWESYVKTEELRHERMIRPSFANEVVRTPGVSGLSPVEEDFWSFVAVEFMFTKSGVIEETEYTLWRFWFCIGHLIVMELRTAHYWVLLIAVVGFVQISSNT
ncbi:hypothetical protein DPMN_025143, partial [Dreissena polymorpha]